MGATHRVIILAEDLNGTGTGYGALSAAAAASTSGTLTPFGALPAGKMCQFVSGYLKSAFVPASISSLTVAIGYTLGAGTNKSDGFLAATDVRSTGTPITYLPPEIADQDGSSVDGTYGTQESTAITALVTAFNALIKSTRKVWAATDTVNVVFTSISANLTDLVGAGELHLYFRVVDFTKL